jgi:hypothetical protein
MAQQLTGPDYLMVAADELADKPFAEDYKAMLFDAFPDGPESQWTEGQRVANGPIGERDGLAAVIVSIAAKMAIERQDWESLHEVIGTGARMVAKFPRYLKATGRASDD